MFHHLNPCSPLQVPPSSTGHPPSRDTNSLRSSRLSFWTLPLSIQLVYIFLTPNAQVYDDNDDFIVFNIDRLVYFWFCGQWFRLKNFQQILIQLISEVNAA